MVEKWLLQVENMMIMSIRKVIEKSLSAYVNVSRNRWVIEWPGQVYNGCLDRVAIGDWTWLQNKYEIKFTKKF